MTTLGHAIIYALYIWTKLLRWSPAFAAGFLSFWFYDFFHTDSPLPDYWEIKETALWQHVVSWVVGGYLFVEAVIWPVFLYWNYWSYTQEIPLSPHDTAQNRQTLYHAMLQSFCSFKKVRKHPPNSDDWKAAQWVSSLLR